MENRKRWIFLGHLWRVKLLLMRSCFSYPTKGGSLLPKGIKKISGNFSRGDVVRILNLLGNDLAHGVTHYNSDALRLIAGHHSQEINQILGYEYGAVAVHRDDMIVSK